MIVYNINEFTGVIKIVGSILNCFRTLGVTNAVFFYYHVWE